MVDRLPGMDESCLPIRGYDLQCPNYSVPVDMFIINFNRDMKKWIRAALDQAVHLHKSNLQLQQGRNYGLVDERTITFITG